jgi:hypothetical protein
MRIWMITMKLLIIDYLLKEEIEQEINTFPVRSSFFKLIFTRQHLSHCRRQRLFKSGLVRYYISIVTFHSGWCYLSIPNVLCHEFIVF